MTRSVEASLTVPDADALSNACEWFWRLASWRGVHDAVLSGFGIGRARATLRVVASKRAMRRVRSFCTRRGYREEQ